MSHQTEIFINDSLLFEPGQKYSYSTHAWTLLSLAMENAYGDNFINLMNEEIFTPMQLINTHAEQYDLSFENKVSFYEKNDSDSIIESNPVNNSWKWAGGGYISTTEEMAKFTWSILNSDFLRPDVLNLMLSPQELMDGNKTSYGIGWAIREKNNQTHNINGDTAAMAVAKSLRSRRLLLMTNVDGVLDKKKSLIGEISSSEILEMIKNETITGGMIPKINACLDAVSNGVTAVGIINGTKKHSCLWEIFSDRGSGTLIRKWI